MPVPQHAAGFQAPPSMGEDEVPTFVLEMIEASINSMPVEIVADLMRAVLKFLKGRYIKMSDPRFGQLDQALKRLDQNADIEDCAHVTQLFKRYFAAPNDQALEEI